MDRHDVAAASVLSNVRSAHAITILLVLEVLILAELTEQSEENVQTFYKRLLVGQFVHWHVEHRQY